MAKIIIDAHKKRHISLNFKEIYEYRELLLILVYRDLRIRYANTTLGFLWVILQPVVTVSIFTLVFGIAIRLDTQGTPYPLFAFSGMFAWVYFSYVMGNAGASILNAQNLVTKIYFPRLIVPLSKGLVAFVDLAVNLCLLGILSLIYGFVPSANLVFLPLFLLLLILCALGVGIWLSALIIRFRDFQQVAAFALQIGAYLSPIAYPSGLIPADIQPFYFINPMAGIIESFRWAWTGGEFNPLVFISYGISLFLFGSSLFYFKKVERVMADIL